MARTGQRIVDFVAPRAGYLYIRLLGWTMRLEYRNREVLDRARRSHGQYILAFWHSRFIVMPFSYPDRRIVVLSSQHRDARRLVEILRRFGITTAWGSSTEGGAAGLRAVLRHVREGHDVGITPDGPRGPRRRVKPGIVAMARLGGKPIIPVAFSARPARRLDSWDRTLLPWPFARGLFLYGEPIEVPRDIDDAEQARYTSLLEHELDRLTDLADAEAGTPVEDPRPRQAPS